MLHFGTWLIIKLIHNLTHHIFVFILFQFFFKIIANKSLMMWTVFPGPWRVDGKGIAYIRCTFCDFDDN